VSFDDKILTKYVWESARFYARRLIKEFPNKNWKTNIGRFCAKVGSFEYTVMIDCAVLMSLVLPCRMGTQSEL